MRRLLLLLLALGLWQIAYAQVHCGLEPAACEEGRCELCHLGDVAPLTGGVASLSAPVLSPRPSGALRRCALFSPSLRRSRGRAPPR